MEKPESMIQATEYFLVLAMRAIFLLTSQAVTLIYGQCEGHMTVCMRLFVCKHKSFINLAYLSTAPTL